MSEEKATRCGFVALIGAPNVGKSTLLNRLVGTKVSIVSPKVQTTRRRVLGISVKSEAQLVFVDLPGIFGAKRRLERAMVEAAWQGIGDADLAVLVIDAKRGIDHDTRLILERLTDLGRPCILAINKLDLVPPQVTLPLIQKLNEAYPFEATFVVSAETGDGCEDLGDALFALLPEGPWHFPEDQLSDLSDRQLAAELTREQIFRRLHQELPYSITVETDAWAESPEEIRADQTVYVQRDSQKAIVLGKGGRMIREIGQAAREEMESVLGKRVHLFLFVKVREAWTDDPERYREMGLEFPKG